MPPEDPEPRWKLNLALAGAYAVVFGAAFCAVLIASAEALVLWIAGVR